MKLSDEKILSVKRALVSRYLLRSSFFLKIKAIFSDSFRIFQDSDIVTPFVKSFGRVLKRLSILSRRL